MGQACGEPTTLVEALIAQGGSIGGLSAFIATSFSGLFTHFGLRSFGALYGALVMALSLGTAFGPLAAGTVFDRVDSYVPFLLPAIVLMGVSALALSSLDRPPETAQTAARSP